MERVKSLVVPVRRCPRDNTVFDVFRENEEWVFRCKFCNWTEREQQPTGILLEHIQEKREE